MILALIFSLSLSACNLPQNAMRATATMAAAMQTAVARIYPSPTPPGFSASPMAPTPQPTAIAAGPTVTPPPATPTPQPIAPPPGMQVYYSQSGDTLSRIASHYGAGLQEIQYPQGYDTQQLLPPGLPIFVPAFRQTAPYPQAALPDLEVVYGPGAQTFDTLAFAQQAGGFLNEYAEPLFDAGYSGPEIVELVARETSTNPRLLMALIEFRSGWVFGRPALAETDLYPLGLNAESAKGLYAELQVIARMLAQGYYGWREGSLNRITFKDKSTVYIEPSLNAGTVALQVLFGQLYRANEFEAALYGPAGFLAYYGQLFPDVWEEAQAQGPLLPANLVQPVLQLPFLPGLDWAYTSGPHITWQTGTPRGALDFAPGDGTRGCNISQSWATAAAPGLVVRSSRGAVAIDLDGDGDEGTGWVLVYMHLSSYERVAAGTWLNQDDKVGHPSCEGGKSTGTHLHITRKYNGEWLGVDAPLPFILGPWEALAGPSSYQGWLRSGEVWVANNINGIRESRIHRE